MELITEIQDMVTEKMPDFMDKAPGLVSLIITLIIVAGLFG